MMEKLSFGMKEICVDLSILFEIMTNIRINLANEKQKQVCDENLSEMLLWNRRERLHSSMIELNLLNAWNARLLEDDQWLSNANAFHRSYHLQFHER